MSSNTSKENVHPNAKSEGKITSTIQASAKLSTKESTAGKLLEHISEESYRDEPSLPPPDKPLFVMGKTKFNQGKSPIMQHLKAKQMTPVIGRPGDRYIPQRNKSFDQEFNLLILNNSSHAESSGMVDASHQSPDSGEEAKEPSKKAVPLDERNQLLVSGVVKKEFKANVN